MPLDFPNSPTNGQIFSSGGMLWRFDGTKWVQASGVLALPDAPSDGNIYGRENATWTSVNALLATPANAALNDTGRNLIHNGTFTVAQRGAGGFTAQGYTLDRWYLYVASDTDNVSQNALADVQRTQIGDEAATVSVVNTFTGNAAAGAYSFITQNIEGVRRLAGKTVTVSFWAWCGSGALQLGVSIDQNFGTGGSPSAAIAGNGQSVTLSPTATRFSLTFSIASAAGKTLGTAGNDLTALNFWFSSGTTQAYRNNSIGVQSGAIGLWGVQLEIGSVATPLAKRDPADELALCQRFALVSQVVITAYQTAGGGFSITAPFPVTMRGNPTISITTNGNSNITGFSASGVTAGGMAGTIGYFTGSATATGPTSINVVFLASADL